MEEKPGEGGGEEEVETLSPASCRLDADIRAWCASSWFLGRFWSAHSIAFLKERVVLAKNV